MLLLVDIYKNKTWRLKGKPIHFQFFTYTHTREKERDNRKTLSSSLLSLCSLLLLLLLGWDWEDGGACETVPGSWAGLGARSPQATLTLFTSLALILSCGSTTLDVNIFYVCAIHDSFSNDQIFFMHKLIKKNASCCLIAFPSSVSNAKYLAFDTPNSKKSLSSCILNAIIFGIDEQCNLKFEIALFTNCKTYIIFLFN